MLKFCLWATEEILPVDIHSPLHTHHSHPGREVQRPQAAGTKPRGRHSHGCRSGGRGQWARRKPERDTCSSQGGKVLEASEAELRAEAESANPAPGPEQLLREKHSSCGTFPDVCGILSHVDLKQLPWKWASFQQARCTSAARKEQSHYSQRGLGRPHRTADVTDQQWWAFSSAHPGSVNSLTTSTVGTQLYQLGP